MLKTVISATVTCLAVAVWGTDWTEAVREDLSHEVRPGGIEGRPFWNANATLFMYPPAFDFPEIADGSVTNYRFEVVASDGRLRIFRADRPTASLKPVWHDLPPGNVSVVCRGEQNGNAVNAVFSGARVFWKSAPFTGNYPPSVCSYAEAARRAFRFVLEDSSVRYLAEKGEPDPQYPLNSYPTKMLSSLVNVTSLIASREPDLRLRALGIARSAADWLIAASESADRPLAHFPPTYRGDHNAAKTYAGVIMLNYPATAALAYLRLWETSGEEKYRKAAVDIAGTYLKLQESDGTWPLRVCSEDGRPSDGNRLLPLGVISLFERLHRLTGDPSYRRAAKRALDCVFRTRVATWNWEGQFEDVAASAAYRNLTKHDACSLAIVLAENAADEPEKLVLVRELLRFAEDQFVCWEKPFSGMGLPANPSMHDISEWYPVPCVLEQYRWYNPIDASAAKLIRTYLALYRAEHRPLDLAKARALGDAMTRVQESDGRIPTGWAKDSGSNGFWINCHIGSVQALDELARETMTFPVKGASVVYEQTFAATKDGAWGRDAAEDLARILSLVTKSEVKAYSEAEWEKAERESRDEKVGRQRNCPVVYVGSCQAAKDIDVSTFSPCEFRIKVTTNAVFLVGRTETAASYAMTEFVERFSGYRFLSQNGENPYDVNSELSVPVCDFTRKPAIAYREVYRCGVRGWLEECDLPKTTANFSRFSRQRRLRVREADIARDHRVRRIDHSGCHNAFKYLPVSKYFKDHPDWYSMDEHGNRINIENAGGQLCYSNAAMRDEFAKNLLAMIEADARTGGTDRPLLYDIGQGVCCTALCRCPNCMEFANRHNRKAGGHWEGGDGALQLDFANDMIRRVHAKHPEINLSIYAYLSSEECPRDLAAERGVATWFSDLFSISDHMLPLEHPLNRTRCDNLKAWVANSTFVKVWDFMMYGTVPEVNAEAIAADAKLYRDLGLSDLFMETEYHYQPFYDLNLYLMGELYFDPDQDVEKLIDGWCRVYGKAAPKMREAIDFLRRLARENPPDSLELWHARRLPWYTAENFEKLRTLCLEAYEMDDSPAVRQRIAQAIAGTDDWLMRHYRGIYGKESLADERRQEHVRMTKVWATYELTDPVRIAAVEKKIEDRVAVATIRFKNLPDELENVPADDLKCLDWRGKYLMWTANDESALVDDADSETGKAVMKRFRQQGAKLTFPIPGGVYDVGLKKPLCAISLDIPEKARDGRFHWYRLGSVRIDRYSKLWLFPGWGFQCSFFDGYTATDGTVGDLNTFGIWISVKVPSDVSDVRIDRVCLRRMK